MNFCRDSDYKKIKIKETSTGNDILQRNVIKILALHYQLFKNNALKFHF